MRADASNAGDIAVVPHQRSAGRGAVAVRLSDGRIRLDRQFQEGSAKIRFPSVTQRDAVEAVLINTSGGLTGGDRLRWDAEADTGAALTLTTPAQEKAYRTISGAAEVDVRLSAGAGATLAWLPQETLLFEGSHLERRIEADLAAGSRLLAVEATLFGRLARGERIAACRFRDSWRIRCEGRLAHAEELALEDPAQASLEAVAGLNGAVAMATILLVAADAAERLDGVRAVLGSGQALAGASAWRSAGAGKLVVRLAAADGYSLRKALVPVLEFLHERPLPRIWGS